MDLTESQMRKLKIGLGLMAGFFFLIGLTLNALYIVYVKNVGRKEIKR